MDITTALTGMLPAVVIVSALMTAAASVFLLWRYRRATVRMMSQIGGVSTSTFPGDRTVGTGSVPRTSLTIKHVRTPRDVPPSPDAEADYRRTIDSVRASALIYTIGGLVYAGIMTTPWMIVTEGGFYLGRFLWLLICYAWPVVFVLHRIGAVDRTHTTRIVGGYFVLVTVAGVYALSRSPELTPGQLVFFWLFANTPGTVLLLAFLRRRVRAVGPLVLAFMTAGATGMLLFTELAGMNDSLLRGIVAVGDWFGLEGRTLFVLMHVVGFAAFAVLGWQFLIWIGRRYRMKRASDQSLTIDSMWLLFAVVQSITLVFEGWQWIFTGLLGFAGYRLITSFGFNRIREGAPSGNAGAMLLLLRVFALGDRSERFFDVFSKRWRHYGSISMIAGPDLVTTSVEPHEFLEFVSGRHSRRFVQNTEDLDRRLRNLDREPDPDGRFRVNEFFCHANTWQMTMRHLAETSRVILLDLRSFGDKNQGCLYELEQILNIVDLQRVVFLVDQTTDLSFLEDTLHRLWKQVLPTSPNAGSAVPTVLLFHVSDYSRNTVKGLLLSLFDSVHAATLSFSGGRNR